MAIFSHGIPNNIYGGTNAEGDRGWDDGIRTRHIENSSYDINFADDAIVYLGGCNAGTCRADGRSIAQAFADKYPNIEVYAMVNDGVGPYNETETEMVYGAKMGKRSGGTFMLFKAGQKPKALEHKISLLDLKAYALHRTRPPMKSIKRMKPQLLPLPKVNNEIVPKLKLYDIPATSFPKKRSFFRRTRRD